MNTILEIRKNVTFKYKGYNIRKFSNDSYYVLALKKELNFKQLKKFLEAI